MSKLSNHELQRIMEQARLTGRTEGDIFREEMEKTFPVKDRVESISLAIKRAKAGKVLRREVPLTSRLNEVAVVQYHIPNNNNASAVRVLNQQFRTSNHRDKPEELRVRLCAASGIDPKRGEFTPAEIARRSALQMAAKVKKAIKG